MSPGGKAFICLTSTFTDKQGEMVSRITPLLNPGDIVTDPRSLAYYIVTEYGGVNLVGCSTWERAERLISVAHPKFRWSSLSTPAAGHLDPFQQAVIPLSWKKS